MLCSVEARVPFVDNRLVERMAGVPFKYRFENGVSKSTLKRLFKNYLPEKIINREKIGFPVPISKIFNNNRHPMDQWLEFNMRTLNIEY